jgi:hypothetical protein
MKPYRYDICLRLRHPSIDPDKITRELGMPPYRCWSAGEPRTTPANTPLSGTWRETYWCSEALSNGALPGEFDLPAAIERLLDRLQQHKEFFRGIRSEGGIVELFVGWYLPEQGGEVLGHALSRRLGDLMIDLSLDIYPPDQPQNDI